MGPIRIQTYDRAGQATFSFSRSCSGGVTCGSAPGNVTLNAGAQTTVSQSYSVGSPGTGTIILTASGTNATDQGSYSVPIEPVYVGASVVNGESVIASEYVVQETAVTYDAVGRIEPPRVHRRPVSVRAEDGSWSRRLTEALLPHFGASFPQAGPTYATVARAPP